MNERVRITKNRFKNNCIVREPVIKIRCSRCDSTWMKHLSRFPVQSFRERVKGAICSELLTCPECGLSRRPDQYAGMRVI